METESVLEALASAGIAVGDLKADEMVAAPAHLRMFEAQLGASEPHEVEFDAFRLIANPRGLVFDVGGNIGNSALSLHLVQPTWSVISFEPNLALRPFHERVAATFAQSGTGHAIHYVGLGANPGTFEFYVPKVDTWHVIGEASFRLSHFLDPVVGRRLSSYSASGRWSLSRTRFTVVRFDDYEPAQAALRRLTGNEGVFVKMDVEGFEESALAGMEKFLKAYRPMMMIENDPSDRVPDILKDMDFAMFAYDTRGKRLVPVLSRSGHLNLFYAHRSLVSAGAFSKAFGS